jgi:hypothetical protein
MKIYCNQYAKDEKYFILQMISNFFCFSECPKNLAICLLQFLDIYNAWQYILKFDLNMRI